MSGQPRLLDAITAQYALTSGEKILLSTNGFMVTERIAPRSFGKAFLDIYKADLPLFISNWHDFYVNLHMSYDEILKQTEEQYLIPKLKEIFIGLSGTLPQLDQKYGSNPAMKPSLMDLDLFLTVGRSLLEGARPAYYAGNAQPLATVVKNIGDASVGSCAPLFLRIACDL